MQIVAAGADGTEVGHVTRDSDTTFKVKRSNVRVTGSGHIVAASRPELVYLFLMMINCCNDAVTDTAADKGNRGRR